MNIIYDANSCINLTEYNIFFKSINYCIENKIGVFGYKTVSETTKIKENN